MRSRIFACRLRFRHVAPVPLAIQQGRIPRAQFEQARQVKLRGVLQASLLTRFPFPLMPVDHLGACHGEIVRVLPPEPAPESLEFGLFQRKGTADGIDGALRQQACQSFQVGRILIT